MRLGIHVITPVLLVVLSSGAPAVAQDTSSAAEAPEASWRGPLASRNQTPLTLLFLYLAPESASVLGAGQLELGVSLDYSNIILDQETEKEKLRLDLEYLRTLVVVERGFGGGVQAGFSIPVYVYYGGFLDPLVSSLHKAFGLPNFLRSQTPAGLVDFEFFQGQNVLFQGQDSITAVGDLVFDLKKSLVDRGPYGLAIRGALKLPTGTPEKMSGSGATDFGFGVAFDRLGGRFGLFANANYHFLGNSDRIEPVDFFSFMGGFDFRWKRHLAVVVQADYVRPPLKGELPVLNEAASQLALGLRWRHSERFIYEWRLVEDLAKLSPDFTFAFQIGMRFRGAEPR